jgi:GxxExxY protein
MTREQLDQLGTRILDAAFEVHRVLGPGLLENAYEIALCHELARGGISFERQKEVPVLYKSVALDCGYRLDLLVEQQIVVELKSCEQLQPIHDAILLNYLRLTNRAHGYLINFNVGLLKNGLRRKVNHLAESNSESRV